MKNRPLMLAATALLILPFGNVLAAGNEGMSGSIELGAQLSDGEDEGAKFQEYQDLDSSIFGDFRFDYFRDSFYFKAEADNAGLDDQYYQLDGGIYQNYDYSLFYDEIPHNISFGARSFYSGLGSDRLTIEATPSSPDTWRSFDYTIDTKRYGADVELFKASPYFLSINVNRQEKDGLRPLGSGSFSGVVEMPEPIDYQTNNFILNGGYRGETMSLKLSGLYSTFDNDNTTLDWENPFLGITEHNSLPMDNDFGKVGATFTWRQLPWMSTLAMSGSYSDLSSDLSIFETRTSIPTGLNRTEFDGDIATTRLSAAFTSRPMDRLDTRVFYKYYDRDNDSSVIEYDEGGNDIHLFDYSKHTAGLDGDYSLAYQTRLSGGYTFENVERRNRPDGDSNQDNLFFAKLKNTSLDYLTAKVEYTYLNRDTDPDFDLVGLTVFDAAYINQFMQRFDVVSKSKHAVEFAVEVFPLDALDFGLSYTYVENDYDDVILGRTEDTGHEFYLDFLWRAARFLTLNGFAGYENYEADSNHYNHQAGAGTPPQTADPTIEDGNPSSFLWSQDRDEDFWTVGLATNIPLMRERLLLGLSFQYQKSDGESSFTSQGPALEPINEYEDYYITTFEAKVKYAMSEALAVNLGYIFEETDYDDLQYLGYDLAPGGTYLTGAYSDHDYDAQVGYVTVQYNF